MNSAREGGSLVSRAHQISGRVFARVLKEYGIDELNPAQGRILFELWKEDGLSQAELAQRTRLDKSTLALMLDRLEEDRANQGRVRRPTPYCPRDQGEPRLARRVRCRFARDDRAFLRRDRRGRGRPVRADAPQDTGQSRPRGGSLQRHPVLAPVVLRGGVSVRVVLEFGGARVLTAGRREPLGPDALQRVLKVRM
jgi:MarR family